MAESMHNPGFFHHFVERQRARGELICQPRMGFSGFDKMRRGLEAVKGCEAPTIGTLTLDSYTRVNDLESARRAIELGHELNGYPIVAHGPERNRELLDGLLGMDFPIQVRHGTSKPEDVFQALIDANLEATEGGPISYCLPYSRTPLRVAFECWSRACSLLATLEEKGTVPHLESFGGCMLGQLCPPSLLVAIGILEGLFSRRHGLRSISLSYAQNSNFQQDAGAVLALRELAAEFLPDTTWHVVIYSFMGKFPQTELGARALIEESARLAAVTGCERLIVKTAREAHQIPTIEDNVRAIGWAYRASLGLSPGDLLEAAAETHRQAVYEEARFLVEMVLDLHQDLTEAILVAFREGYLDIPYCLHADNRNQARCWVDHEGNIHWTERGKIPFPRHLAQSIFKKHHLVTSHDLERMLSFNQLRCDSSAPSP